MHTYKCVYSNKTLFPSKLVLIFIYLAGLFTVYTGNYFIQCTIPNGFHGNSLPFYTR